MSQQSLISRNGSSGEPQVGAPVTDPESQRRLIERIDRIVFPLAAAFHVLKEMRAAGGPLLPASAVNLPHVVDFTIGVPFGVDYTKLRPTFENEARQVVSRMGFRECEGGFRLEHPAKFKAAFGAAPLIMSGAPASRSYGSLPGAISAIELSDADLLKLIPDHLGRWQKPQSQAELQRFMIEEGESDRSIARQGWKTITDFRHSPGALTLHKLADDLLRDSGPADTIRRHDSEVRGPVVDHILNAVALFRKLGIYHGTPDTFAFCYRAESGDGWSAGAKPDSSEAKALHNLTVLDNLLRRALNGTHRYGKHSNPFLTARCQEWSQERAQFLSKFGSPGLGDGQ